MLVYQIVVGEDIPFFTNPMGKKVAGSAQCALCQPGSTSHPLRGGTDGRCPSHFFWAGFLVLEGTWIFTGIFDKGPKKSSCWKFVVEEKNKSRNPGRWKSREKSGKQIDFQTKSDSPVVICQ